MSEPTCTKHDQKKDVSCNTESCNLRVPLKAKATQKISENKNLKKILKTRPHPELKEQRLLIAVSTNNTERVQELLESGVNPNATDRQLRSALHLASSRGYIDIVRLLLDYGADPNKLDIVHNTPLHLAACLNNFKIIKMLLDAGTNVHSLDVYGKTPVQLAESKLLLLQKSLREGAIELSQLRSEVKQVCSRINVLFVLIIFLEIIQEVVYSQLTLFSHIICQFLEINIKA